MRSPERLIGRVRRYGGAHTFPSRANPFREAAHSDAVKRSEARIERVNM
jgi:hypothetical protein